MKEIRWTDKVWLDNQGNIHDLNEQNIYNLNEQHEKPNLTDEQIKNLEEDGFFDDLRAEQYRLSVELYNED